MAMQDPVTDKKKAIFDSTLQLIREHGFHGTSMNGVAKNASVATGTIYHYFESKDQLICEIYDYYRDQLIKLIEEAIDNSQAFKENFQRIWFILYHYYTSNTNILIFFEQFINSPYNTDRDHPAHSGPLYDFFKKGMDDGFLKQIEPRIAIVLTLSSVSSTAKLTNFSNFSMDRGDLESVFNVLWDGFVRR